MRKDLGRLIGDFKYLKEKLGMFFKHQQEEQRRSCKKLHKFFLFSFDSARAVTQWNKLPLEVVSFLSLDVFKQRLNGH